MFILHLIRGQGHNSHITGTTREDINTHQIKYKVNNLTNRMNLSVQVSNFSILLQPTPPQLLVNSLRPLLGHTSNMFLVELLQCHPSFNLVILLHLHPCPQIFLGSAAFLVLQIQILDLQSLFTNVKNHSGNNWIFFWKCKIAIFPYITSRHTYTISNFYLGHKQW